jgi:hypothetical protein
VTNLRSSMLLRTLNSQNMPQLRIGCLRHDSETPSTSSTVHPQIPVVKSRRPHPIPSRTRKLSSSEPMVLLGKLSGRVGRRRVLLKACKITSCRLFFFHSRNFTLISYLAATRTTYPLPSHSSCSLQPPITRSMSLLLFSLPEPERCYPRPAWLLLP